MFRDDSRAFDDDAPKSVTEESSLDNQQKAPKKKEQKEGRIGNNNMMDSINHNFDQSERFDDSMVTPQTNTVPRGRGRMLVDELGDGL